MKLRTITRILGLTVALGLPFAVSAGSYEDAAKAAAEAGGEKAMAGGSTSEATEAAVDAGKGKAMESMMGSKPATDAVKEAAEENVKKAAE